MAWFCKEMHKNKIVEANDTRLLLEDPNSKPQDKYRV